MQNGQTEPTGDTRRRTSVRREVTFVHSVKHIKEKFAHKSEISFCSQNKTSRFTRSGHFSKAGLFYYYIYELSWNTNHLYNLFAIN